MSERRRRVLVRVGRGFSLIEVMIVIVILALLSGLAVFALSGRLDEAQDSTTRIQLETLKDALFDYKRRMGSYPTEEEGIAVLWDREALADPEAEDKWSKTLEDPLPTDPFGQPWNYNAESEHGLDYDLWSNGPDGEEGTEDDITNWGSGEGGEGGGGDGEFDFDFDSGG